MKLKQLASLTVISLGLVLVSQTAMAKERITPQAAKTIQNVKIFYENFTQPTSMSNLELIQKTTTTDWQSCQNGEGCRGQEVSAKAFGQYAKMIPDMRLTMQEIMMDKNKVIVRGELTGTPSGDFFGVPHTGKSFKIMTIDIHTIRNGKIAHT